MQICFTFVCELCGAFYFGGIGYLCTCLRIGLRLFVYLDLLCGCGWLRGLIWVLAGCFASLFISLVGCVVWICVALWLFT